MKQLDLFDDAPSTEPPLESMTRYGVTFVRGERTGWEWVSEDALRPIEDWDIDGEFDARDDNLPGPGVDRETVEADLRSARFM